LVSIRVGYVQVSSSGEPVYGDGRERSQIIIIIIILMIIVPGIIIVIIIIRIRIIIIMKAGYKDNIAPCDS
jgi:hypothetical protein